MRRNTTRSTPELIGSEERSKRLARVYALILSWPDPRKQVVDPEVHPLEGGQKNQ